MYLELVPSVTTSEFIRCLKKLIARRGRPNKFSSDNAKTFIAGVKVLQKINEDAKWHHQLNQGQITWKVQNLYKFIGRSQLTYNELKEILLDVKINLNNRPLTYVEDDIQLKVLTSNSMILGRDVSTINSTADDD